MDLSTTKTFKIRACETDHLGQLKLSAIFQLMQEAADKNAKKLKLSYDKMNRLNEIWVLSRIHAKFFNIPKWEDEIKIKTWPVGVDGIFAIRDYLIQTTKGDLVGKITSSWLIVDAKKRRVKKMRDFPKSSDDRVLDKSAERVRSPKEMTLVSTREVQKSELDVNKHVNNAIYYNWITDSLSLEIYNEFMIDEILLNYSSETRLGDKIGMYHNKISDKELYVIAKNENLEKIALVAKINLSKRTVL